MHLRLEKLRAEALAQGMDAVLLSRPENMRYFSGYSGEGCALVTADSAVIITDFRYTEQAENQAPGWQIEMTQGQRPAQSVLSGLLSGKEGRLAVEHDFVSMAEYQKIGDAVPLKLVPLGGIPERIRQVKDAGEIEVMRRAAAISVKAFEHICQYIKPGLTEKAIQLELDYTMRRLGAEGSAFSSIVAAGPNGSLPHAVPTDRPVQNGDLITLDFGAAVDGYCMDMTRTVAVGEISKELRAIYDHVKTAQQMALDAVRPGVSCKDIDSVARDHLEKLYPGRFGHGLGHSLGLLIHESPAFNQRDDTVLKPGMVMTVEPGVYIPGLGGCRIEDSVLITDQGYENFISATKELIIL